jgi:hypothetical protein
MEPPAFLALFKGRMVVHLGRRGEDKEEGDIQKTDGELSIIHFVEEEHRHNMELFRGCFL